MTSTEPDLLDDVERLIPGWSTRDPRRLRVARWRSRPATISGRQVEIALLPAVGARWLTRRHGYWLRRIGFGLGMAVAVAVLTTLDVGFAAAAAGRSTTALLVTVAVLIVAFALSSVVYWRADLVASPASGVASPVPVPARYAMTALSVFGLLTPALPLALLVEQLPRFPLTERRARELVIAQLTD